ncbi:MMPL family transporter [Natronolimnohabitans sp. A-GB9]|uniref:efflux RND transporter permease subunit n=1 Tax=Natronolimnohabitans sp. A-GB9 TaxID=3069757 RepID=UPI0027AE75D2|nr:MMPL family transporter [Natronolimnohabitans sp. A-GB9]MDQ2049329.1 MMPL family transporter [Natronolimnohabitans sp. A-GB9]
MRDFSERIEGATERLNETIVSRPKAVVLVFLVLTVVFAAGIPLVETETDATDAFTDDLEEQQAYDAIEEEFEGPFVTDEETTQIVHTGSNVLTREELLASITVLEQIEQQPELRMESANGPAPIVAQAIDEDAQTLTQQRRVLEGATDTEIRTAVRALSDEPEFEGILADDFNSEAASASASITVVSHDVPAEFSDEDLSEIQLEVQSIAEHESADITAFGSGVIFDEFENVIGDSLAIVMPVVVVLMLAFLMAAYRDPIDLGLGLFALLLTIVWTFGFLGYVGIPFDQQLIAVPVLLLAVGVDFGIHIINRYREETVQGFEPLTAMRTANNQLMIAFIIVTVTSVFGFGANAISDLEPIRNMGIASGIGMIFTFLIFGIMLPSMKLIVDRLRDQYGIPEFNSSPIASEESTVGRILSFPAVASQYAPTVFVIVILILGGGMGAYGTGVDTSFDDEDFLPPEEEEWYVEYIPEPFAPGEYTVTETINTLEDRFDADQDETVTIYVEGPFEEDHALEALDRAGEDPPESLAVGPGGGTDEQSIITVIQSYAEQDEEFAALVDRNDRNNNGIPDRNLDRIYDELFASPAGSQAEQYLTEDRRGAQIEYVIDAEASQEEAAADGADFAEDFHYTATATGTIVIFDAITEMIFESAVEGLILALGLSAVFLVIIYGILERRPMLGIVNLFPIAIAVAFLIGTMRLVGMPLNALTATILAISIGLGIAYTVHTTARFIDEYADHGDPLDALTTTLSGTGGALAGSMLTTSLGTGALALAITPVLGDFGLLMALSVFYSFVSSIVVLPPALFLWARFDDRDGSLTELLPGV